MSIAKAATAIALTLIVCAHYAQASSLEGAALEAYDTSCPAGNYRAVWAEELPGILTGWVHLVCLDEDEQETSYWYVNPDGDVVSSEEAELPVYVRPMAELDVIEQINGLADDENITLWLDFKYDEPDVPPLEAFGYPEVSFGFSGSATGGPGGQIESYYELNGVEVTEAEYLEWSELYRAANRAQQAERDRLILEQVHLSLYNLVDINHWHDWIDINDVNNGISNDPRWEFSDSLVITLTGKQSRALLQSSEALVYVSIFYGDEFSSSSDNGDGEVAALPIGQVDIAAQSSSANELLLSDQDNTSQSTNGSAGGAVNPTALLILVLLGWVKVVSRSALA